MSCVYHRLPHWWLRGLTRKSFLGGLRSPRPPPICRPRSRPPQAGRAPLSSVFSTAVVASEGQCLGSCPRSASISMSRQDDLGQAPACSALAMDPQPLKARGAGPVRLVKTPGLQNLAFCLRGVAFPGLLDTRCFLIMILLMINGTSM